MEPVIENDLEKGSGLKEDKYYFTDIIRKKWDELSIQSVIGSRVIKLIQTVVVFLCIHAVCEYGMQFSESMIRAGYKVIGSNPMVFLGIQVALALLWWLVPDLATVLCVIVIYMSLGGLSPLLMLIACVLMLAVAMEDRTVELSAIAMPALIICLTDKQWLKLFGESYEPHFMMHMILTISLGIFITVFASFVSTRYNNGIFGVLSFPVFGLFSLALGLFGKIGGEGVKSVVSYKRNYWPLFVNSTDEFGNNISDFNPDIMKDFKEYLMQPTICMLVIFIATSVIFLLILKYDTKGLKLQMDIRDGIAFTAVAVLLCGSMLLLSYFAGLKDGIYTVPVIMLQTVAAYVLTRPLAGRMSLKPNVRSEKTGFIFISYAHKDFEKIKPYLGMLKKEGLEYWYDNGIRTGDEWQGVIASNLAECDCFLAFISKNSITSEYCIKEINYATSKQKPIAVVMLEDVPVPPVLEMHLASLQAVQRYNLHDDKECMDRIMELEEIKKCKL